MIIDAHAHGFQPENTGLPGWASKPPIDRIGDLLTDMDAHGVRMAAILKGQSPNEMTQNAVREHPDRFIGFCCWDMGADGKQAAEQLEKWLGEPEFKAVGEAVLGSFMRLGREMSLREVINEWRLVMDVISAKKVPILFHYGYSGGFNMRGMAHPLRIWDGFSILDELAPAYPDVPIILGHSGGLYAPYDQLAILLAYNNENVYLETSKSRTDVIEQVVSQVGASRILFGSDWVSGREMPRGPLAERPTHLYHRNIKVVKEARISDEDKDLIFYKNFMLLLNLFKL